MPNEGPHNRPDNATENKTGSATTNSVAPAVPSPSRSRPGESPWRLQVVEAWFERARKAGLKTAQERLDARQHKDQSK